MDEKLLPFSEAARQLYPGFPEEIEFPSGKCRNRVQDCVGNVCCKKIKFKKHFRIFIFLVKFFQVLQRMTYIFCTDRLLYIYSFYIIHSPIKQFHRLQNIERLKIILFINT